MLSENTGDNYVTRLLACVFVHENAWGLLDRLQKCTFVEGGN